MSKYADIHAHPTLRPYAYSRVEEYADSELATLRYKTSAFDHIGVAKYTQSDFVSLYLGKVKLVFASLYPFEQHWFDLKELELGDLEDDIIALYLKLPEKRIEQIQKGYRDKNGNLLEQYNYWHELQAEMEFLKREVEKDEEPFAIIPHSGQEIELLLQQNKFKIFVIPTIEGAHSLINGNSSNITADADVPLVDDISYLRDNRVFFITFAHHFNNGLVQHAKSIYGAAMRLWDQSGKISEPFSSQGIELIRKLLALDEPGDTWRILIDVKHMGINARKFYYEYVSGKDIPVIYSHAAFSGLDKLDDLQQVAQEGPRIGQFAAYEINVTTEDVYEIYKSRGILGLIMDEKKLGGLTFWQKLLGGRQKWVNVLKNNLLEMVARTVEIYGADKGIWDIFALGSDFDGVIDPLDKYPTAAQVPLLAEDLTFALKSDSRFKKYNFGYAAHQVVEKIFFTNVFDFLIRNYGTNGQSKGLSAEVIA